MKRLAAFIIAILVGVPAGIAPSHPTFVDAEGGVAPDSFWYNFDVWWDDARLAIERDPESKAILAAEISAERLGEAHSMLESNNLQAVHRALGETEDYLGRFSSIMESVSETNPDILAEIEKLSTFNNNLAKSIESQLEQKVETGEISAEDMQTVAIEAVVGETSGAYAAFEEKKEQIIESIAEIQGVSTIEVELEYESKKESDGLLGIQKESVYEDLIGAREQANALEDEYKALPGDSEERVALVNMIEKAKLNLQITENAFETGNYGEAFGHLTAAESMLSNADRFLSQDLSEDEIERLKTGFHDFDIIQKEIEEESKKAFEEYGKYKEELKQKYPEKADMIEKEYERSQRVSNLADKVADELSNALQKMIDEGKSESEAIQIVSGRFADEYRKAYGEEYVPPGFIFKNEFESDSNAVPLGEFADKQIQVGTGGGFVAGYSYQDPSTGYKYEFTETGWKYTTPAGESYEQNYPQGFVPPKTYEKGNEVYKYKIDTSEGSVEYVYTATGYEVVKADGTKESFAYDTGKYKLLDGKEIEHKPTGFEIKDSSGRSAIKYDYDPNFDTYVSKDGTVYKPPEGAYVHSSVNYDSSKKGYTFSEGSDTWTYSPSAKAWSSSTGQSYKPEASLVAPVGYENQQSYTTQTGESWKYDTSSRAWKSSKGDEYSTSSGEYKTVAGGTTKHAYQYAESKYEYNSKSGEYKYEVQSPSGQASYAYDSSSGSWKSAGGEGATSTLAPPTTTPQGYTQTSEGYTQTEYTGPVSSTYQSGTYYDPGYGGYVYPQGSSATGSGSASGSTSTGTSSTSTGTSGTGTAASGSTTLGSTSGTTAGTTGSTSGTTTSGGAAPSTSGTYSEGTSGYTGGYSSGTPSGSYSGGSYSGGESSGSTPSPAPSPSPSPAPAPSPAPSPSPSPPPSGQFVLSDVPDFVRKLLEKSGFKCTQDVLPSRLICEYHPN